jgi:hypothetical protein
MTEIAVVGLGYVGLPLALAFGRVADTVGVDLSADKVAQYKRGVDPAAEVDRVSFEAATRLTLTTDFAAIADAKFIVVAVPTPVDGAHNPDFGPLIAASRAVGAHMHKGATVIYESTVYPGATEEVCLPILEEASGLEWRKDFHIGYSPERINPGDPEHRLETIVKVVAGDDAASLERIANPGVQHPRRRSGKGYREYAARSQYRPDERTGDHLRPGRPRHARGLGRRADKMEFPAFPARPRRRSPLCLPNTIISVRLR